MAVILISACPATISKKIEGLSKRDLNLVTMGKQLNNCIPNWMRVIGLVKSAGLFEERGIPVGALRDSAQTLTFTVRSEHVVRVISTCW
jgi:uncharacterized DUF497 family protein